jgi:hypothetical protein
MAIKAKIQCKSGHKVVELNRRQAIRERCLNCSAWSYVEVERCSHADCTLHPFRSGTGKQNARQRAKTIRAHCAWCMATEQASRCVVMACPLFCYRKSTVERLNIPLYEAIQTQAAVNE